MSADHFGKWYSHKKTGSNFDRLVPLALPKDLTVVVFTGKSPPTRRINPTRSRRSVGQLTLDEANRRSNWRGLRQT